MFSTPHRSHPTGLVHLPDRPYRCSIAPLVGLAWSIPLARRTHECASLLWFFPAHTRLQFRRALVDYDQHRTVTWTWGNDFYRIGVLGCQIFWITSGRDDEGRLTSYLHIYDLSHAGRARDHRSLVSLNAGGGVRHISPCLDGYRLPWHIDGVLLSAGHSEPRCYGWRSHLACF